MPAALQQLAVFSSSCRPGSDRQTREFVDHRCSSDHSSRVRVRQCMLAAALAAGLCPLRRISGVSAGRSSQHDHVLTSRFCQLCTMQEAHIRQTD